MRGQEVGNALAVTRGFRQPAQRGQHAGDALGIPSGRGGIARAELVGLQLVVAAELEEHQAHGLLGRLAERPRGGHEHAERHQANLPANGARVLLGGVARRHVPDFVPEHARKLRFVFEERQDAAGQVDVAARAARTR